MSSFGAVFAFPFGGDTVAPPTITARTAAGEVPRGRFYITVGGERIDQVAYAVFAFQSGAVEALLTYNYGLGKYPPELPPNLAILLPELTSTPTNKQDPNAREVALWG